jgi:hypothetical protein
VELGIAEAAQAEQKWMFGSEGHLGGSYGRSLRGVLKEVNDDWYRKR